MKRKTRDGIVKYFLRGLVAAVVAFLINLPLSFVMALVSLGGLGLVIIPLYLIYLAVVLVIAGWVMTKTVKNWVK